MLGSVKWGLKWSTLKRMKGPLPRKAFFFPLILKKPMSETYLQILYIYIYIYIYTHPNPPNLFSYFISLQFCQIFYQYIYSREANLTKNHFLFYLYNNIIFVPSSVPLLPGSLWSGLVVPVRVPSIGQKDKIKNYFYMIGSCEKMS